MSFSEMQIHCYTTVSSITLNDRIASLASILQIKICAKPNKYYYLNAYLYCFICATDLDALDRRERAAIGGGSFNCTLHLISTTPVAAPSGQCGWWRIHFLICSSPVRKH